MERYAGKSFTKNSMVLKKYTNGGSSKGEIASLCKYQGWSNNGMKCFNELFDLVKANRKASTAKSFEQSFQVYVYVVE